MPSKSRLFSQLIAGSGQIKADRLSDDISTIEQVASTEDLTAVGNTVGDQRVINNNLYIWNGTGWYRIALINANPTWDSGGQPAASYELDADSPQDPTIITLAASDPDGITINYSYVTSGSMDSMATISQDSSIFTITPKTVAEVGEGVELTGSITFRASDGVNILPQVSSFTLNFISIVTNSKYTSLLATATGTSDNNNITDTSTNNHSITVNGDAYAGAFSPYRNGGYSTYFDGAGDYLNAPSNAAFEFGTGDFSVELFFYRTVSGSVDTLVQYGNASVSGYTQISWAMYISSSNYLGFEISDGTPGGAGILSLVSSVLFPTNSWVHVSVVRDGNNFTLYQNGNSVATTTDNRSVYVSNLPLLWIARNHSAGSGDCAGFFSNVRIVKGTAVYTANFTPPSEPLTAISGTALLTCHLPYIADGSTNAHSITVNGNTSTKPFSPYDYDEYSATDHGGSVFLGGTAHDSEDRLEITRDTSLTMGSGDFTYEAWVYLYSEDVTKEASLFSARASGYESFILKVRNSGTEGTNLLVSNSTGTSWSVLNTKGGAVFANVWTHVAIVRNGTSIKVYTNGKEAQSHTFSGSLNEDNNTLYIGYDADSRYGLGHVSDVRITKGTAVYTTEFTPPTAPLSSSGASLLIKGTDASIVDKAQTSNVQVYGTATGSTTQVKFVGSKSMYFAGSLNDKIIAYAARDVDIPDNGAYTFEAWCYFNSVSGVIHMLSSADVTDRIAFELRNSKLAAMVGGSVIQSGSQVLSTGQWYHLAISRVTGSPYSTTRFFVNGNLDQTSTIYQQSPAIGGFNEWYIGSPTPNNLGNGYNEVTGYMQDVRFTEGLGRYTANFTPPTKSLEG